jgi:hypothetical protein
VEIMDWGQEEEEIQEMDLEEAMEEPEEEQQEGLDMEV